jgi:hypothetical protein
MPSAAPLIIHFHIPRTGGTTVGRMLKFRLGFWPPSRLLHHHAALGFYRIDGWENRVARIEALSPRARKHVRLFEAHAGYGLHDLLPQPSLYVTMLREPIDRALSAFFYIRRKGLIAKDETIESFLARADVGGKVALASLRPAPPDHTSGGMAPPLHVWWLDNAFVRFLAGERGRVIDVPHRQVTRAMLDVAIERLSHRVHFFGVMERFDASMVLLRRTLHWPHCHYIKSKANDDRQRVDEVDRATIDLLRERNTLDLELYARANELLNERIAAQGDSFAAELARFGAANAAYAKRMARLDWIVKFRRRLIARRKGLGKSE